MVSRWVVIVFSLVTVCVRMQYNDIAYITLVPIRTPCIITIDPNCNTTYQKFNGQKWKWNLCCFELKRTFVIALIIKHYNLLAYSNK